MPARDINGTGALGLSLHDMGEVAQALAADLVDRGYPEEVVLRAVRERDINEDVLWDQFAGPAVDWLEEELGLEPRT